MRKTIHKLFWAWDFDKEEKWLNEMAALGLALVSVGFCRYDFEAGQPGEYEIRLEMLDEWPTHPASEQYIHFVEDTGAEHIGSLLWWVYFRKQKSLGSFDLFSDIDSRIKHLNRIVWLVGVIFLLNLMNALRMLSDYFFNTGYTAILVMGMICGLLTLLVGYGFIRLWQKKRRLQKERALHE